MVKVRRLLSLIVVFTLLLFPVYEANCQEYIKYDVTINSDGSAAWKITQVSDINASIDTFEGFQQKVFDLVDSAAATTNRKMALDVNSLQIETVISSESKTTEYVFTWQNFSVIQNEDIVFGDVFRVPNFFVQLYGDASLQITTPSTFSVKSVSPEPNERGNQTQTFVWYRTQDFVSGKPNIVLTSGNPAENGNSNNWQLYLIASGILVATGASIAVFFIFKRRRSNAKTASAKLAGASMVESDEEKIINILKSSGGTSRQSDITEQSKFSKAKASQLLAVLEQKGIVTRYKKGRDKIVTLHNNHNRR